VREIQMAMMVTNWRGPRDERSRGDLSLSLDGMSGGVGRGLLWTRVEPQMLSETTKFWGTSNGGVITFASLVMNAGMGDTRDNQKSIK
jgi:hypothetical protein